MLAGCTGTLGAMLFMWMKNGKVDASMSGNGLLAGLVAITAPSGFVSTSRRLHHRAGRRSARRPELLLRRERHEGRRSSRRHLGPRDERPLGRALGRIFFADGTSNYGGSWNGVTGSVTGLFYGDASQLAAQLVGISTLIGFVFTFSFLINLALEFFVGQRVSVETEIAGLDLPEMGQLGYPEFVFKPEPDILLRAEKAYASRLI